MVDGGFLVWVLVFDDSALQDGFGWITVAALVSTVVFFGLLAVMALAVQLGQSDQMSLAGSTQDALAAWLVEASWRVLV